MRLLSRRTLKRSWTRFHDDQSGMALIYVTMALPVIIGMSLLAIDYGRLSTLHSSLQHGVDALALAGAGELDKKPDAITRAERVIRETATDGTRVKIDNQVQAENSGIGFGDVIASVDVDTCYLDEIPPSDATPIDNTTADGDASECLSIAAGDIAASSKIARFVQVVVHPQNLNTIFPATFVGAATNTASTKAEAVAGFQAAVCKFTPLFMCNPFEPTTGTTEVYEDYGLYDAVRTKSFRRRLTAFKSHSTVWSPGNFGFLVPATGHGTGGLAGSIVAVNPPSCFVVDDVDVDTLPGNRQVLKKAFNVRLDLYESGAVPGGGGQWTDYPPAVNVRKGYVFKKKTGGGSPDPCVHNYPTEDFNGGVPDYTMEMGFPNDACHYDNSCTDAGGRMGGGDWGGDTASTSDTITDFYQYWNFNHTGNTTEHPDRPIPTEEDLGIDVDGDGTIETTAIANDAPPSRYAIYRYEIAQGWETDKNSNPGPTVTYQESGTPICKDDTAIDNPDRRIIYGALINCRANGLDGGSNSDMVALAFGKFFMTRPMDDDPDDNAEVVLYSELIDVVEPGDANAVARDIVQLYR